MTFASWKKQRKDNIFNIYCFHLYFFYINCATLTNLSLKHILLHFGFRFFTQFEPLNIPYLLYCLFKQIFQYVLHLQAPFCDFLYTCYYHPRRLSVIQILSMQQCQQILLHQGFLMYRHYTPLLPNHPSEYKNSLFYMCKIHFQ